MYVKNVKKIGISNSRRYFLLSLPVTLSLSCSLAIQINSIKIPDKHAKFSHANAKFIDYLPNQWFPSAQMQLHWIFKFIQSFDLEKDFALLLIRFEARQRLNDWNWNVISLLGSLWLRTTVAAIWNDERSNENHIFSNQVQFYRRTDFLNVLLIVGEKMLTSLLRWWIICRK